MTEENHNKLIAWLLIGLGGFGLFNLVMTIAVFAANRRDYEKIFELFRNNENFPLETILYIVGIFVVFTAIFSALEIVAGWGMLRKAKWARVLAIIVGAVNLIAIPFGTALGIYSLWFLTNERGKNLYEV